MVFLVLFSFSSARFVLSIPYSVVVRTDNDTYLAGEYVEISGFVMDQGNVSVSTFVEIDVSTPENISLFVDAIHSDSNGYFLTILALPTNASLGTYLVTATAEGPASYTTFEVILSSITCLVNSSWVYPKVPILVYGRTNPARRVEVSLELSRDDGDWQTIANVYTNTSGHYSYGWTAPKEGGNYLIRASLEGTASSTIRLRVIAKEPTMISFSLSSYVTQVGKSLHLEGILNSTSRNATIIIRYEGPDGASTNHTVLADPNGAYRDTFEPYKEGTWTISASWSGDAFNLRAESIEVQVSVGPPPPTVLFLLVVAIEDIIVLSFLARHMYLKHKARRP